MATHGESSIGSSSLKPGVVSTQPSRRNQDEERPQARPFSEMDTKISLTGPSSHLQKAKSHHTSKLRETSLRRHRTARGAARNQTAETAVPRQKSYMTRQKTGLSTTESRSAGVDEEAESRRHQNPHDAQVDPKYYDYVPWYGREQDQPLFGLNRPLPRTVRPGMRRMGEAQEDRKAETKTAEQEEEDIEAAQVYDAPNFQPDIEKGEAEQRPGRDSHDREGDRKQPGRADSHISGYFGQTPGRSRSTGRLDFPILPPGEEPGEKTNGNAFSLGEAELEETAPRDSVDALTDEAVSEGEHPHRFQRYSRNSYTIREDEESDFREHKTQRHNSANVSGSDRTKVGDEDDKFSMDEEESKVMDPYELQLQYNIFRSPVAKVRAASPRFYSEFLASTMSIFLGTCINLSVKISEDQKTQYGSYETQCLGWGFAFMIGIYLSAGVSGAHLNPVISIVLCIFRGFPLKQCLCYIAAQLLGGFAGGGLAYTIYQDALNAVDPDHDSSVTGSAWFPGPQAAVTMRTSSVFLSEFMTTGIFICVILALGDDQNAPPGAGLAPFVIAIVVSTLMMATGYNSGPALNPARDLGPRLVARLANCGENPFSNGFWWWGAWCATISGGIVGALVYDVFIFVGGESPVNYRWVGLKEAGVIAHHKGHRFAARTRNILRIGNRKSQGETQRAASATESEMENGKGAIEMK